MIDMFDALLGYSVRAWLTIGCDFRISSGLVYNRTGSNAEMAEARLAISPHAFS